MVPQIALLSAVDDLSMAELTQVAAAIQLQINRDATPIWSISGTIGAFQSQQDAPPGCWPVTITTDDVGQGLVGYHQGPNNQPFARVHYDADWTVGASHEVIEMLVDPFASRYVPSPSPKPDQGQVSILVETCDPPQAHFYNINGVDVSDFVTPAYYNTAGAVGGQYSFLGTITSPLQVLPGGYMTWWDPISNAFWQLFVDDNGQTEFVPLTQPTPGMAARSFADKCSREHLRAKTAGVGHADALAERRDLRRHRREQARAASAAQAKTFEAFLEEYQKNLH